jgi:tight adherence protein B
MKAILGNDWIMAFAIGTCVFIVVYLWADTVIKYLRDRSLGSRDEIIKLLDLMFVVTDRKRITTLLLLLSFGLGTVVFFALFPNITFGLILGGAVVALGWSLPIMIVKNMHERRASLFTDQMVDGLTIMANGIKSGLSITQSMERVVENMANPISQEFNLVLSQIRIGRSVEDALIDLGERIPKADVQMFVTAINILKETGGNLAETFQTIVYTIRERQKIEKKIQAMTAQGIMQGIIISIVPVVLMVILLLTDPKFIMPMFTTTLGLILTASVFVLIFIGGMFIRKIVKINV